MKTPSLEMFTAQLNVEPSTTWLKFDVGSDLELCPPALEQEMVSTGYEGFEKPKLVLRSKNGFIYKYLDTSSLSSYACTEVTVPVCSV